MSGPHPLIQNILEAHGAPPVRPAEPPRTHPTPFVWYRGWECNYDGDADFWGHEPWRAAKGGWDLDCIQTSGRAWSDLLDEIDAWFADKNPCPECKGRGNVPADPDDADQDPDICLECNGTGENKQVSA